MVRALAAAWRGSLLKKKMRWDDDRLLWSLRGSIPTAILHRKRYMFGSLPLTFIFYRPPLVQFWYPSDYCAQRSVSFDKIFLVLSVFLGGVIFCFFARARVPSSGTFSSGEFYSKRKIIITSFAAAACVCDSESLGVRAAKIMIVIESLRFWFFLLVRFFFFFT